MSERESVCVCECVCVCLGRGEMTESARAKMQLTMSRRKRSPRSAQTLREARLAKREDCHLHAAGASAMHNVPTTVCTTQMKTEDVIVH